GNPWAASSTHEQAWPIVPAARAEPNLQIERARSSRIDPPATSEIESRSIVRRRRRRHAAPTRGRSLGLHGVPTSRRRSRGAPPRCAARVSRSSLAVHRAVHSVFTACPPRADGVAELLLGAQPE